MSSLLSPLGAQIAFAQGHVFNDMCAAMWFNYLLVYLQYVAEFKPNIAGAAILIGQLVDGIFCPLIGVLSDKMRMGFLNYGRRKSAHLLGTVAVFLTFPFVFMPVPPFLKNQDQILQLLYYSVFISVFQIGWATVQIAHLAIITDLSSDFRERTWLMSLRNIFTVVSISAVFVIAYAVRKYCPYVQVGRSILLLLDSANPNHDNLGPNCTMQFVIIVGVISAIGLVETLWYHVGVQEVSDDGELSQNLIHSSQTRISPWSLFGESKFYSVTLVYVAARLFFNLLQVFIPLYLIETLGLPVSFIFIIPLVINLSNFATSVAATKMNVLFGRKITFYIGCIFGIISGAVILVQRYGDLFRYDLIFIVAIVLGIATSILTVTALSLITDMIGQDANNGAFVYGFMSLIEKVFNGVGVQIIQSFFCCFKLWLYYLQELCVAGMFQLNVRNKPEAKAAQGDYEKYVIFVCCLVSCLLGIISMYFTPSNLGLVSQTSSNDQRTQRDSEKPLPSSHSSQD